MDNYNWMLDNTFVLEMCD